MSNELEEEWDEPCCFSSTSTPPKKKFCHDVNRPFLGNRGRIIYFFMRKQKRGEIIPVNKQTLIMTIKKKK